MKTNKTFFESNFKQPDIKMIDGHLSISGNSIGLCPEESYSPVIRWVANYHGNSLKIEININMINCSSVKWLLQTIVAVDLNEKIKEKSITWFFKDKEEMELGDMIASNLKNSQFKLYCKN